MNLSNTTSHLSNSFSSSNLWFFLFKSFLLALCFGFLIIIMLFFIKKIFYGNKFFKKDSVINIISSHYLSPRQRIALIEVLGEKLLIGISPQNIRLITKLKNQNTDISKNSDKKEPKPSFSEILKNVTMRKNNDKI